MCIRDSSHHQQSGGRGVIKPQPAGALQIEAPLTPLPARAGLHEGTLRRGQTLQIGLGLVQCGPVRVRQAALGLGGQGTGQGRDGGEAETEISAGQRHVIPFPDRETLRVVRIITGPGGTVVTRP